MGSEMNRTAAKIFDTVVTSVREAGKPEVFFFLHRLTIACNFYKKQAGKQPGYVFLDRI